MFNLKAQKGLKVLETAKKDINLFEGLNNTGETQKYAKYWNEKNPKDKLPLNAPYCGLSIYYWFMKSGLNPNIIFSPRAINYKLNCKNPVSFISLSISDLKNIPISSVIIYKNSWGNHVGLFEKAESFNIYTIEGNTSSARSLTKFNSKKQGVFYTKTKINNSGLKPFYYCDCVSQSTEI